MSMSRIPAIPIFKSRRKVSISFSQIRPDKMQWKFFKAWNCRDLFFTITITILPCQHPIETHLKTHFDKGCVQNPRYFHFLRYLEEFCRLRNLEPFLEFHQVVLNESDAENCRASDVMKIINFWKKNSPFQNNALTLFDVFENKKHGKKIH